MARQKSLLLCGLLSSLLSAGGDVLAALRYEGYSYTAQTISELSAIGAPTKALLAPIGIAYELLLLAFALGVWRAAGSKRAVRITADLLAAIAAVGLAWQFAPMHMRGAEQTLTDTVHIVFAGIMVPLILVTIGFGAAALGKRFRLYSVVTIVVLLGSGVLTGLDAPRIAANLPTPWVGIAERINVFGYYLWVAVLAIGLLRIEVSGHR